MSTSDGHEWLPPDGAVAGRHALLDRLLEEQGIGRGRSLVIPRRPNRDEWPLSFSQQRIWFLDQFEPGCHYNDRLDFRLSGRLDVSALERSLGEIVRRHEVLRAVFVSERGRPQQRVSAWRDLRLPIIDLSVLPESERWSEATERALAEARLPFALGTGPLFRMTLYRLGDHDHLLACSVHHIAIDGWSRGVFEQELVELYTAFVSGGRPSCQSLSIQYADYAAWQRERLRAGTIEADVSYWRRQLAGVPPETSLPTDKPRPIAPSFDGERYSIHVAKELLGAVRRLGTQSGCTLFMTLLAAFKTLLSRYSNQDDIVVGTPVANRNHSEVETLIGFFVNTLVLRTDLSGGPSFRGLLGRIRNVAVGAYAHQELPFEKLVEELQPQREQSRNPFFQVMFILQTTPHETVAVPGISLTPIDTHNSTSKFDLTFNLSETADGLSGWIEYATDLFDAPTIERLAEHYRALLGAVANAPDVPINELALLLPSERRRLLIEWNDTGADGVRLPVHRPFEQQAARTPDALAVTQGAREFTYAELDRRASRLASQLRAVGVEPDQTVGILTNRSLDGIVAVLAILKAGGACVPLDAACPSERLAMILDDARPALVLTQPNYAKRLPETQPYLPLNGPFYHDADPGAKTPTDLDHVAYVIFTSGSTGRPKGVAMTHRALANLIDWQRERSGLPQAARTLQFAAWSFDVALQEMFSTWCSGGTLILASEEERRDPVLLLERIERAVIARIFLPVVALQQLADVALRRQIFPAHLRDIITAGEQLKITPAVRAFCQACGCTLHNHYGPSETHVVTSLTLPAEPERWPDLPSIGRPVSNARIYLLDAGLNPVPIGVPGELYIAGDCLARGYVNQPDLTAERFLPDPYAASPGARVYRTGDVARYRSDGAIDFIGRRDQQVKIRGYRVELAEIEAALIAHSAVDEAVVIAREDRPGNKRLVAYVVTNDGDPCSSTDLRDFLSAKLPEYMVPAAFVFVPALPTTPSGKINRLALPAADPDRPALSNVFVAPLSPVEKVIAKFWSERLGVDQIGVNDSFFELGGHSLLATEVMFALREALGVDLPLRCLFEAPTIAGLAAATDRELSQSRPAELLPKVTPAPEQRYEPFDLTDVQQAYWIGRSASLSLGGVSCHMYTELDVADLDLGQLESALHRLIDRHDMLRAVVWPEGRQQVLREVPPYRVAVSDLRDLDPDAVERELQSVRERMSFQVMPSDRWPLFEVRVSQLSNTLARVHVDFDLLIGDALSIQILVREFLQLYNNPEVALEPLEITFRDYAIAEAQVMETAAYENSRLFWLERLASIPPAPQLPMVKNPVLVSRPRFVRRSARVAASNWRRLKARAARAGLTPSGVLLGVFAEVLTAWSKSPRYTINVTLFNRLPMHPQVNSLVGDFTSVTLLAVDHSMPDTFERRARALQDQLWENMDHRYFSGVRVLRELLRVQGTQPTATMPVVFTSTLNLDHVSRAAAAHLCRKEAVVFGISQTPQAWLDHQVFEDAGDLVFIWDAVDELFPRRLLDDLFDTYCRFVSRLTEDEGCWQEVHRLLLPDWQIDERREANSTDGPIPDGLLHDGFLKQVIQRPEQRAVAGNGDALTYEQLYRRSVAIANCLRDRGASPNELVAIVLEKGSAQVAAAMGVLQAGSAYLPVDPTLAAQRFQHVLEQGRVRLALTESGHGLRLRWPGSIDRICVDQLPVDTELEALEPKQKADDLAYVIFTSGSTAVPKGVMIDHRGALNTVADVNDRFGVGPADRILALSSLSFDLSVYDIFGTLAAGATIVMPSAGSEKDPAHWTTLMAREGVTIWNSVPALLEMWVDYMEQEPEAPRPLLRLALLSGDWIPIGLTDRLRALITGVKVVSLGGATEASIWSILYPINGIDPGWRSIPYGRPMRNQQFHVLDQALDPRPVWVPGQLFIGGVGLAKGYWRDEEKTDAKFVRTRRGERLYATGDFGRYLPGGDIEFLGREDLQVKIHGHRIELAEIEAALAAHPHVKVGAAAAVGEPPAKRLVAYVVPLEDTVVTSGELRRFLADRMPGYMVPSGFVMLDSLPLTANGKVDRQALPQTTGNNADVDRTFVLPRTPIELAVAEIWKELLEIDRVGAHDHFFELGGDSLVATRSIVLLRKTLRIDLSVRSIFDAPTLSGLATAIEERLAARGLPV